MLESRLPNRVSIHVDLIFIDFVVVVGEVHNVVDRRVRLEFLPGFQTICQLFNIHRKRFFFIVISVIEDIELFLDDQILHVELLLVVEVNPVDFEEVKQVEKLAAVGFIRLLREYMLLQNVKQNRPVFGLLKQLDEFIQNLLDI